MNPERRRRGLSPGTEALLRRIEQTRSSTGHPLRCAECHRLSSGRATGWKMHHGYDGDLFALCPECGELGSG